MKELKKNLKRKMVNRAYSIVLLIFFNMTINAQIEKLPITNGIDFNLPTKQIISEILADKSNQLIRIDTSTNIFPSLVYRRGNIDSICVKFNKQNFSSLSAHLSDSCSFFKLKLFSFENFKITKGSINNKKQLYIGKIYDVSLYETKGINDPKYNFWISSKKYKIKI